MTDKSIIRKSTHTEVTAKANASRILRFICATDDLDRDRDIVLPAGLQLDDYLRNPCFLWCHRFDQPPIGRAVKLVLGKKGRELSVEIEFSSDEFSDRIFKLYKGGFLNGVSVGFKIIKAGPPDSSVFTARPDIASQAQRVIYQALLLEISAVPIPSNPHALQAAVSKGIVTSQFVEESLDPDRLVVEILERIQEPQNVATIAVGTAVGLAARVALAKAMNQSA
jgi:uncharacterized protein